MLSYVSNIQHFVSPYGHASLALVLFFGLFRHSDLLAAMPHQRHSIAPARSATHA